jgi:20S proteasome subunit beta 6
LWSVDDESSNMIQELEEELRSSHPDDKVLSPKTIQTITRQKAPIMIGAAGCSADCAALQRVVRADLRAASYFGQTSSAITSPQPDQVATLLSQILYLRRGFPYYSFCVLSGMNDLANSDGSGQVYVYDAIGSYEQVAVATSGTGREALQPILDRLFACTEQRIVQGTADQAIQTLCEAYRSVSEREIGVGDNLVLHVTERRGQEVDCRVVVLPLKQH